MTIPSQRASRSDVGRCLSSENSGVMDHMTLGKSEVGSSLGSGKQGEAKLPTPDSQTQ